MIGDRQIIAKKTKRQKQKQKNQGLTSGERSIETLTGGLQIAHTHTDEKEQRKTRRKQNLYRERNASQAQTPRC